MPTILIAGYYGAGNTGDEAILEAMLSELRSMRQDLEFIVVSLNPVVTESQHHVHSILYTDIPAIVDACQGSDLILLGGGGLFHDYWGVTEADLLTSRHIGIPFYCGFPLLAKLCRKPIMLYSVGVGPLFSEAGKRLTGSSFQIADLVTVRDEESRKLLSGLGISTDDFRITADPSFLLRTDTKKAEEILKKNQISSNSLVAVCLRNWEFNVSPQIWQKEVADALDEFVDRHNVHLVFIPFQHASTDNLVDDLSAARNVVSLMNHSENTVILEDPADPETVSGIISQCDLVIGMRLHSLIFSFKEAIPAVGIVYDPKVLNIMRSFGMEDYAIDLSHLTRKMLLNAMERSWEERESLSSILVTKRETHQELARENIQLAISLLEGNPSSNDNASAGNDLIYDVLLERIREQAATDISLAMLSTQLYETKELNQELTSQAEYINSQVEAQRQHNQQLDAQLNEQKQSNQQLESRLEEQKQHNQELAAQLDEQKQLNQQLDSNLNELKTQSAEKDQKLQRFEAQLEKLSSLVAEAEEQNQALKRRFSWRITRPLRFVRLFLKNPKMALLKFIDFLYWRLPRKGKEFLIRIKNRIERPSLDGSGLDGNQPELSARADLSWDQFEQQVLAGRDEYKGIFIQERNVDWAIPLFQRPQHIASALGRLGYLVLYKVWDPGIDLVKGFRAVDTNVWLTTCDEVDSIPGALRSIYSTAYFFPLDAFQKRRNVGLVAYEYIDHIDPAITGKDSIQKSQKLKDLAFSGLADYVITSAESLRQEAAVLVGDEKVVLIPNGVSVEHYRDPKHTQVALPDPLTQFRNKYQQVIGYFGALAPWLWYDAIKELVEKRSDIGFVFIGPDYFDSAEKLPKAKNLLRMDGVDYSILPAYAKLFDVGWIPFIPGDLAKATSPLKLFEYFALEKPIVVTSDLLECIKYKEVLHAKTVEGLSSAIDQALDRVGDVTFQARLRSLAEENDWNERAKRYEKCFEPLKDWKKK